MWAAIPIMAFLNRFRGGGFGAEHLPGHPRYWVTPVVGALAYWHTGNALHAAIFAACYLAWSLVPWGHAIGLGRWSPVRDPAPIEETLIHWTDNPWLKLLTIEVVGLFPAMVLVSPFAAAMPPLFVACYEVGWRLRPRAPIELAELLTGGLWGLLLVWGLP